MSDDLRVSEQAATQRRRRRGTGRDMLLSLGLVAVLVGAWMWLQQPRTPDPVKPVDWWPVAQSAAASASYPVVAPPKSFPWIATSARAEPQPDGTLVWRVGFYTPSDAYAGVLQRGVFPEQAAGSVTSWVDEETRHGVAEGTVTIDDQTWTRMTGDATPDEKRSLVLAEKGTTLIVTGSAGWDELSTLAASLEPVAS